jgi:hypothetical protein
MITWLIITNIKRSLNKASLDCLSLALLVLINALLQGFRLQFVQYYYSILLYIKSADID